MDKKQLTEADIISKFILPAITDAGWDTMIQIRQDVKLRDGKVIVRGQIGIRKKVKSGDIVLENQKLRDMRTNLISLVSHDF